MRCRLRTVRASPLRGSLASDRDQRENSFRDQRENSSLRSAAVGTQPRRRCAASYRVTEQSDKKILAKERSGRPETSPAAAPTLRTVEIVREPRHAPNQESRPPNRVK